MNSGVIEWKCSTAMPARGVMLMPGTVGACLLATVT
jgi:hypothetical protein